MPIKTPGGILEVEDAKLRASYLLANTSVGIGTSTTVPDGASLYIKEDDPTIRFQEGTTTSAARILAKSGTLRLESGTDYDQPELTGDIAFSNIQGGTTHMIIKGDGNVGIGKESPSQMLDVSGNVQVGTANLFVDTTTGRVGVGVTEMTSTFEVAGNTATQEYPPQAMTGDDTYINEHGVFKIQSSTQHSVSLGKSKAFDKDINSFWHAQNNDVYPSGVYSGTHSITDYNGTVYDGEWISIEFPYQIYMSSFSHAPRTTNPERSMEEGTLLGWSQSLGGWEVIKQWTGLTWTSSEALAGTLKSVTVNATKSYNNFVFAITKTQFTPNIAEIKIFGTPAPSSLEDGHLTLGKALTTPRVSGHPAGAETPRAESLVVHYDTTVDSVASGSTVVDTSGNGVNGTFNGSATYSSSDRAFQGFPSSYVNNISATLPSTFSGAQAQTHSYWINGVDGTPRAPFTVGYDNGSGTYLAMWVNTSSWNVYTNGFGHSYSETIQNNRWYHVTVTYDGGSSLSSYKLYIDGVYKVPTSSTTPIAINLPSSPELRIGRNEGTQYYNGKISKPKLYDVVLTADEVAAEYALGRTGKAINVTDTAVCLGGTVPRAQLDVRGAAYFENIFMSGYVTHALLNEAEFVWDLSSHISYPGTGNVVYDINGNMNGNFTAWTNFGETWRTDATSSKLETASTMDLRRDWTVVLWHKSPSTFSNGRILGHGQASSNDGLHVTAISGNMIRYGMHNNDVDVSSSTGLVGQERWCQYAMTYFHNGGTAGGCNKKMYQNEKLIGDDQAGLGDGTYFSGVTGGSAATYGFQPYQATPTVLRVGTTFGNGDGSVSGNWFGPVLFFGRVLSGSEIRSIYRFYSMRFSNN